MIGTPISTSDIRYLDFDIDGAGNKFVIMTESEFKYDARVYKITPDGKKTFLFDIPGDKASAVSIKCFGTSLYVIAGTQNSAKTAYPAMEFIIESVCVPFGAVTGPIVVSQPTQGQSGVDAEARKQISNIFEAINDLAKRVTTLGKQADAASQQARDAATAVSGKTDAKFVEDTAWQKAIDAIDFKLGEWVAYKDTRLLNLIWDRGVKLLRFKEKANLPAERLPINSQENIKN